MWSFRKKSLFLIVWLVWRRLDLVKAIFASSVAAMELHFCLIMVGPRAHSSIPKEHPDCLPAVYRNPCGGFVHTRHALSV